MEEIRQFFEGHLDIVFLIYGVSFIIMGIAVLSQPRHESRFKLSDILWLLVTYAFLHSIGDFYDMHAVYGIKNSFVAHFTHFTTYVSYMFFFEFGRRLTGLSRKTLQWWILPAITAGITAASALTADFHTTLNVLVGYFIRIPAGVMAGMGFIWYYNREREILKPLEVKKYFAAAGIAFLIWSFFCGACRARANFFPANWLNTESFAQHIYVPVYVFRTACAIVVTVSVVKILRIFEWERVRQLKLEMEQKEQAREEVKRRSDMRAIFNSILKYSLEPNISREEILKYALDLLLGIQWLSLKSKGSMFLVETDPNLLILKAQNALPESLLKSCAIIQFGQCLCGQAALTQEVRFENHLTEQHTVRYEGIIPHGHYCVPIVSMGKTLGVMNLYVNENHPRSKMEEEFLRTVADTLAGILERKNAEIEQLKSEKKYRRIINDSFDPIITLNAHMEITGWNKGAELIFGYGEQEALCKHINFLFPAGQKNDVKPDWTALKEKGVIKNSIVKSAAKNNKIIFVNITASSLGKEGFSVIARDVTSEKMIDRMKSDFVSNVSHELRTPLTSIKGAVELLLTGAEGPLSDSQKEFLTIVKNNSARLIKLISDLLDLSKIEAGKIEMEIKRARLGKIIADAVTEIKMIAVNKGINISVRNGENSAEILCDENRIRQVLINLMGNAIKFTPQGGAITVTLEETEEWLQINVTDTGTGIAKEDFTKLFEKFQQLDSSSTRPAGGTGLGLAISKSIVEAHKGRIWLESKLGQGSTFSFALPKTKEDSAVPAEPVKEKKDIRIETQAIIPNHAPAGIKKILVVDDDEDIARVIRGHLEKEGYEVIVAHSGLDAVKKAVELQPHLITLDVLMPNMDGFTVAELLKQNPKTQNIPVVIVSIVFDKEKGYKLGVADYITKPFDHEKLIQSIKRIEMERSDKLNKKKILIVDDDSNVVALLTMALTGKNYHTFGAYDGFQAISIAKREKPDIIILDLMLPEMDGYEVIKVLKNDPETADIPIITITGRNEPADAEKTRELGVKEYLLKPFTTKTLLDELDNIITEGDKTQNKR
ncbi:MAG: response regulator [Planctomycetes bacterium]|nr:response regulator [Planctomycetota bacterium]